MLIYNVFATFVNVEADLTVLSDLLSFIGQIVYAPAELFVKRSISNYTPLSVMVCQVHFLEEAGIPFLHKKDTKQNKTAQSAEDLFYFSINLLVVYRESVSLIGYITRRLSADSLQL